jgi:aminoglycoside phosphotransferase (APT) family kinase protein
MIQPDNLVIRKFNFGQSNPTYKISFKDMTPMLPSIKALVLRKKPNRVVHKSAHALDREFQVLQYVSAYNNQLTSVEGVHSDCIPIPQPIAYCSDTSVLQSEFYIMEYVDGRIFVDPSLPGLTSIDRTLAFQDAIRVLSNIHRIPFSITPVGKPSSPISLESFGHKGNYVSRQVQRLLQVSQMQSQNFSCKEDDPIEVIADEFNELSHRLSYYAQYCPDPISLIHGKRYKVQSRTHLLLYPN